MSVIYPTDVHSVSDSFQDHKNRESVNPGTDYTAGYGSKVYSVSTGTVTDTDGNPDGSGGRMIHVDHDDGTGADYLHLSALSVSRGDRVTQGQLIAYSGASGFGSNYGYGAHLHISYRTVHGHAYTNFSSIDFDALVRSQIASAGGKDTPIKKEEDMTFSIIKDAKSATIFVASLVTGNRAGIASPYHVTLLQRLKVNNANDPMLTGELDICRGYLQLINPSTAVGGKLTMADIASIVKMINDDASRRMAA